VVIACAVGWCPRQPFLFFDSFPVLFFYLALPRFKEGGSGSRCAALVAPGSFGLAVAAVRLRDAVANGWRWRMADTANPLRAPREPCAFSTRYFAHARGPKDTAQGLRKNKKLSAGW
jgi:hypothetical protein